MSNFKTETAVCGPKPRTAHFGPKLLFLWLAILLVDLVRFWGGYNGVINVAILSFVKVLSGLCVAILLFSNLRTLITDKRVWQLLGRAGLGLALICYFMFMRGYHDAFFLGAEVGLVERIDPDTIRSWAEGELMKHSGDEGFYIETKDLPASIKIKSWPLLGAYVRNRTTMPHVDVVWGSGMFGTYGLKIGPPEFTASKDILWMPGIYIYRSP